ncbi:MAG: efflux RND transporter permease subunit [Pseudomonadota bacterium]
MIHTSLALRRPIGTVMVFVALALVGLISSKLLPLEKLPDIEFPGIFIVVPYPGSTPEEIERRITRPIEETLSTLSGVRQIRSRSDSNQTELFLSFDWLSDVSTKGIEARARIDGIRDSLPPDLDNILIFTGSTNDQPMLALRISSDRDLSTEYALLDRVLKRRIERIEGVSKVELQGVSPEEIRILLDWNRVAAHQVDIRDLRERLRRSNFAVGAGRVTAGDQRFLVRPLGEYRSLEDVRNTPVNDRGLILADIATVDLRTPEGDHGRHLDRKYAIGLQVFKSTGANMVDVADRIMLEVADAANDPRMTGVNIFTLESGADEVRTSLNDLLAAGALGGLLAIAVLYLFLRQIVTTLIVTLSVPFALLITLAVLYFAGLSLNILTLTGLMLAVGMLVDNAVVITENIFRMRQNNPDDPIGVTERAVGNVGMAVTAGTATSICVFAPIMFNQNTDTAVFMTHVSLTISVALIASLIIAQTLIPMLAARVAPPRTRETGKWVARLQSAYARGLQLVLRRRVITGILAIVILASIKIPMDFVKFDMFPQESSRRMYLGYYLNGRYPLERVEEAVDRVEEYLYSKKDELDILTVYSYYAENEAGSTILLNPKEKATRNALDVMEQIERELPEIIIGRPGFNRDREGGAEGVSVQLSGDSSGLLAELAPAVIRRLSAIEGLTDLREDIGNREQEVQIVVDRERAAIYNLTVESIAQSVSIAMRGERLREFRGSDGEIAMRLAMRDDHQESMDYLAALPLYSPDGGRTELASVANFEIKQGARELRRIDRTSARVIRAELKDGIALEDAKASIEKAMADFALPAGYRWKLGQGFTRHDEAMEMMLVNVVLGIALIFVVMAALFESVLYPLSIITSIAFSMVGVFWFFMLTGTTFSFMATIGILILIGVVVNNGIVLVDHINHLRWQGMARDDAIAKAGQDRLRPILMTVATTVLGLVPLSVATTQIGGNGPPYFPMARAIIGGLTFSTVTSLFLVPYVYVLLDSMARSWRKVLRTATA